MPYYRPCPECGLNLDPGEICECRKEKTATDAGTSAAASLAKPNPIAPTKYHEQRRMSNENHSNKLCL